MDSEDLEHFKTIANRLSRQDDALLRGSTRGGNSILAARDQSKANRVRMASNRITAMFGCYRKDEAVDPDLYLTAAVAVLAEYRTETIMQVTDPVHGLPSTSKFLPSIAELRQACDLAESGFARQAERDARLREQFEAREEWAREKADRKVRQTYEELKAKAGPNWGITALDNPGDEEAKRRMRENLERANKIFFERESAPGGAISKSLASLLKQSD